jgi:hypothetical protein
MRPLGGPGHRWEKNIKIDFKETGCELIDWNELVIKHN